MQHDRKKKLIELGAEPLADALLEFSLQSDAADDLIERLIATPKENIQRFHKKLASLKRSKRFIDRKGSSGYARELQMLLQDLSAGVTDSLSGTELITAFYETDEGILGNCDDSSGCVGDVFRYDAKDLFVKYASRCAE